jgi:hypothetical protein
VSATSVIDQLRDAGIACGAYARPPAGTDVFILGVGRGGAGQIMIWPGIANVTVHGDKKKRQAVLWVDEEKRVIDQEIEVWWAGPKNTAAIGGRAIAQFPIQLPEGTKFRAVKCRQLTSRVSSWNEDEQRHIVHMEPTNRWMVTVRATVPSSSQTVLVGMDETHHFAAELPSRVNSVEAAHKILRPKGLSAKAVRQGEFFFDPVAIKRQTEIQRRFDEARNTGLPRWSDMRKTSTGMRRPLENDSSHKAQFLVRDSEGNVYVRGEVRDTRSGRHEPLQFDLWQRVVRNQEVVRAVPARAATTRPRQRAYWD